MDPGVVQLRLGCGWLPRLTEVRLLRHPSRVDPQKDTPNPHLLLVTVASASVAGVTHVWPPSPAATKRIYAKCPGTRGPGTARTLPLSSSSRTGSRKRGEHETTPSRADSGDSGMRSAAIREGRRTATGRT